MRIERAVFLGFHYFGLIDRCIFVSRVKWEVE